MPAVFVALWVAACAPNPEPVEAPPPSDTPAPPVDLTLPMKTMRLDPDAGDPAVPPGLGGPGFTGEGWTTNLEVPALGSPDARNGGELTLAMVDWPATLRPTGTGSDIYFNHIMRQLVYQVLAYRDLRTNEPVPVLATHWQQSEDERTYRFRLDPRARWHDGTPVTADDVVETWRLYNDPTLGHPLTFSIAERFSLPRALSPYIVEVQVEVEDPGWREWAFFANQYIFAAHQLRELSGAQFVERFGQPEVPVGTGPYELKPDNVRTNESVTLVRRRDWWFSSRGVTDGFYNFDRLRWVVVRDSGLMLEKLKKGELDILVPSAVQYNERLEGSDLVARGMLVKRRIHAGAARSLNGLSINLSRPPFDELLVRQALQRLLDRPTIIDKLFEGDRELMRSYFQGTPYANPDLEPVPYDPLKAVELLEEAGFTELDDQGVRSRDGEPLDLAITYAREGVEKYLTVYQESLKQAGIRASLSRVTPAAAYKMAIERNYDLIVGGWGGLYIPNPKGMWHSDLAKQTGNQNIGAFADPRVDALCEAYDKEPDVRKRMQLVREIDAILAEAQPYVLTFGSDNLAVVHWNRFGMPQPWEVPFLMGGADGAFLYWWADRDKERQLAMAREDSTVTLPVVAERNRFWEAWAAANDPLADQR